MEVKACPICGGDFEREHRSQKYCSMKCRTRRLRDKRFQDPSHWLNMEVICPECEKPFKRTPDSSPARKYCSPECQAEGYMSSVSEFHKRNPEAMQKYNRERWRKHGCDTLTNRLYRKYPDLPRFCEVLGCGEGRVIEAAHKPGFERNGAWRIMRYYERHMFWMLCPTHHKLIDRKICTPEELHLKMECEPTQKAA